MKLATVGSSSHLTAGNRMEGVEILKPRILEGLKLRPLEEGTCPTDGSVSEPWEKMGPWGWDPDLREGARWLVLGSRK